MFMKIYIPTLDRVDDQITFDNLPDKYKENVVFVVQEHERLLHKHDVEYFVVGDNIGIAQTRKEIIYRAGESRFCMYDDDVKFYRRNVKYAGLESDMEKSKRLMYVSDFDEMFDIFNSWMDNDNIIQIGNSSATLPPSGNLFKELTAIYNTHMLNGVEISKFADEVDWTYVKVGEDSMMILEFLLRGYKNKRSDVFCTSPDWWQEGGCSSWRDAKLNDEEHRKLIKKYLGFVKEIGTVTRKNLGETINLKYYWEDAYKYSQRNNLESFFGRME